MRSGAVILPGFIKKTGLIGKAPVLVEDDILTHSEFTSFVSKLHRKILKVRLHVVDLMGVDVTRLFRLSYSA